MSDQAADLWSAQGGDPLQARDDSQLVADARFGDHPAVAHQHHLLESEAFPHLLDLRGKGARIGRVALEDLHSHRTAIAVAD